MTTGKLTIKCQVTIPREIRSVIGVEAGDRVAFKVEDGRVYVERREPLPPEPEGAASAPLIPEWADADEDAYWAKL
jgi:AbrB family looped-hinge helix DNA binding protein